MNFTNKDGNSIFLEKKDYIKYLGVLIDEKLSWKYHIAYVSLIIAQNIGIFSKLRLCMSLALGLLKQLYYSLVYPYITYAILACGSTHKTHVQIKQNTVIRLIFLLLLMGGTQKAPFRL